MAEPAGAEAPDAAGAPVGRFEVPDAAAARRAAVEAQALEARALQWRAQALAAQLLPRRAPDVAGAEPRAALSAAVDAPASAPSEPASPPLVRVWMAPTATHQRLAFSPFRARWSAVLQRPARSTVLVQPQGLEHSVSAPRWTAFAPSSRQTLVLIRSQRGLSPAQAVRPGRRVLATHSASRLWLCIG